MKGKGGHTQERGIRSISGDFYTRHPVLVLKITYYILLHLVGGGGGGGGIIKNEYIIMTFKS
jgi:hypothetical protein